MIMDEFAVVLGRITETCRQSTTMKIIELIESGELTPATTIFEVSGMLGNDPIPAPLLADFFDAWSRCGLDNAAAGFGLRAALKSKERISAKFPDIEWVWTGPYPPSSSLVRNTFAVMVEMIASAKKHIFMTGYSLNLSTIFPSTLMNQLVAARKRGCDLRMALHDDGRNHRVLDEVWPSNVNYPSLLKWTGKPDELASLHAKLLLVDRNDLLITSANFTLHGLSSNMETGVRVKGSVVGQMSNHFNALERAGILRRIERSNSE